MSEPAPVKNAILPSAPPTLGELCEFALTALVNAPGVFLRLSERPAPSPGTPFLLALFWGVIFFALNLIHVALSHPAALSFPEPWKIAAVVLFGLGMWTALYLLGASLIYGLGRALGSRGDFDRALLLAAITLAAAPLQALCSWVATAWALPAVIAAWVLACGLSALFKAAPWSARGVCAVLAAGMLALQYAARAIPSASRFSDLQQQMQQVQAIEGSALNQSVVNMLDSITPALDNAAITKNMTLQQKSDYAKLKNMIGELKTDAAANTTASPAQQQAQMLKIQELVMRMMSAGMSGPGAPKARQPGAKR